MTTEREITMANFTPGPWEVQTPLGPDILSIVPAGKPTYEWDIIADCTADEPSHGITKEEAAANARLIAAAPTLLAILKAAAEDDVVQWHDGSLLKAAREAIAKAEGRR